MADSPTTQLSLLARIRDPRDGAAWAEFVEVYAPLVYGLGRRHGLQDADAADLTQEVLRSVARAAPRFAYDPRRGTFRGWLFTLAPRRLYDFLARRRRQEQASGGTTVQQVLDEQPDRGEEERWNQDVEQERFRWAAEQVRPQVTAATWQAFWRTAVEGESGKDVAAALGLSVAAVYLAKSRVMARLKEQIKLLQETQR